MVKVKRRGENGLISRKIRHHLEKREMKTQTISCMANDMRKSKREKGIEKATGP